MQNTRENYAKPGPEVESEIIGQRQGTIVNAAIRPQNESANQNVILDISAEPETQNRQSDLQSKVVENPKNSIEIKNGRGGRHHQELQNVICRMAESYGFVVEIEKSVLDGAGFVDVSLEKENLKIAAEVSVTSTAEYETHNILKCLAADYDYAVVVVANQKKISALNTKLLAAIPFELQDKVKVFGLTGLLTFLRELTQPKENNQKKKEKPKGQRLSFAEACEFFGVGSSTLYRWIREGRVPFYRPGREYQFDRDELVLIGKHDLSGKRKATIKLEPLKIEKTSPKAKKEQDARYRKLLKMD